jgi:hypothetical protein
MEEAKNVHRLLVKNLTRKTWGRWGDNIKMGLK